MDTNPAFHILAQGGCEGDHLLHFAIRNSTADIVVAHVSFLAERIEAANELGIFRDGEF